MFENLPIEIGIDLATALSIVGASITYIVSERRRSKEESQRDYTRRCERRVDMAYQVVDEVLGVLPIIRSRTADIHKLVLKRKASNEEGADFAELGRAIQLKVNDIFDEVELGLMRPLAVKVETVGGESAWNVARKDFEKSLKTLQQAFLGLEKVLGDADLAESQGHAVLSQAVPLLYGEEKIGGEIHTLYSALIDFSQDLKDGLLQNGDTQQYAVPDA
jgi:hypothetical protein